MNPLLRDRDVSFLLYDVLDVLALTKLDVFAEHSRETFDMFLTSVRGLSRTVLYPAYKPMDEAPPKFVDGQVFVHPQMKGIYASLVGLGLAAVSRPPSVGGQSLPLSVSCFSTAYLSAANGSAVGFVFLTTGAAHLLEAFASDELKATYMTKLYDGTYTGTMALTEPHAGSSLGDVTTQAVPKADGSYRITGSKIFISGGDHDLTENIVHMVLARIPGAPPGTKGISLFCVPKKRVEDGKLVVNDVAVSGVIHKIGWRGLPSVALSFGEQQDCHGYLVGEPHRGLNYMFQMMNEARIMVGISGVASASVAYHEALAYAQVRSQGRPLDNPRADKPVPIVEHADVRRMLLRQKAIVEGGLSLVARASLYADLHAHAPTLAERKRAGLLLDLLTPIVKTFPAERGFEANVLALQVHGGYGYSSEYMPESWMRDQKLNSLHEGTTGIQALDLLGRKAVAGQGAALAALRGEIEAAVALASESPLPADLAQLVLAGLAEVESLTMFLAGLGLAGDVQGMMLHAADYLDLFSVLVVSWQHLAMGSVAAQKQASATGDEAAFLRGKVLSAEYFIRTEVPRLHTLAALCRSGEDSYARVQPAEL
jgi:alkylation response protein AidB-like acyl-CoA dehydrogenase